MAATDHDSSIDIGASLPTAGTAGLDRPLRAANEIWLDGDVLACACPECGEAMSVSLGLSTADCWGCGTSIELTEQQEREALRLARGREQSRREETEQAASAITPSMLPASKHVVVPPAVEPPPPPSVERPEAPTEGLPASVPPHDGRKAAALTQYGTRAKIRELYEKGSLWILWRNFFDDLPAWLVSLIVHLVAILLLGLWVGNMPETSETITLSTTVSEEDLDGGDWEPEELEAEAFEFEDAGAVTLEDVTPLEELAESEIDLGGEAMLPPDPIGMLPDLADTSMLLPVAASGQMFAGRDPTLRAQMVEREGGTSQTEAAVARGLHWLARHQNSNGSWSLHAWDKAPGARGGTGLGGFSDTAGTGLALLPFLGAGQTHFEGDYTENVFNGLKWLIYNQRSDGDLRGQGIGRMYAHGIATIALCEAFALTGDEQLRTPAQLAINYIVEAQNSAGGWRYEPGQAGDTSVVGWQIMALRSGRMAYLRVPQEPFGKADRFLDSVATDRYKGLYGYQPNRKTSQVMTAEALLCRQYLGWPKNHEGLRVGTQYLLAKYLPDINSPNMYYWYYGTQVMHHMGGSQWTKWNYKMRAVLLGSQEKEGTLAGSWTPRGGHSNQGGRIYMTALAICSLEAYYRHLPMYRPDIIQEYRETAELEALDSPR